MSSDINNKKEKINETFEDKSIKKKKTIRCLFVIKNVVLLTIRVNVKVFSSKS